MCACAGIAKLQALCSSAGALCGSCCLLPVEEAPNLPLHRIRWRLKRAGCFVEALTLPALLLQVGLAQMLKGGVIMDVTTADEARTAEEAGAVAVMALERVPADIRKDGGVARMSDAAVIREIKEAVTIPVMAKARIGHFVEAQILEALDVDYVDESEVRARPLGTLEHVLGLLRVRRATLSECCRRRATKLWCREEVHGRVQGLLPSKPEPAARGR